MILGVGFDLCEVQRMQRELARGGPELAAAIFAPAELADGERRPPAARRYAACFAGKEAVLKALAVDGRDGLLLRCVEIRPAGCGGRPGVVLSGRVAELAANRGIAQIHLALRTTRTLAVACAIAAAAAPDPNLPNEDSR